MRPFSRSFMVFYLTNNIINNSTGFPGNCLCLRDKLINLKIYYAVAATSLMPVRRINEWQWVKCCIHLRTHFFVGNTTVTLRGASENRILWQHRMSELFFSLPFHTSLPRKSLSPWDSNPQNIHLDTSNFLDILAVTFASASPGCCNHRQCYVAICHTRIVTTPKF